MWVVLAVAHPWCLSLPISLRSLSPTLAATFMPPRGRPTLVVLSLVASSSVASLSSATASFCDGAAACRSLALASSLAFRRSSALLSCSSRRKKERKKTDNHASLDRVARHKDPRNCDSPLSSRCDPV